jgi:murein L,D-transpeptidase YcbB/YkuD
MRLDIRLARCALLAVLASLALRASGAEHAPLWFENGRLTAQAETLLAILADAELFGLRSRDYALALTPAEREALSGRMVAPALQKRADAAITDAATRFVQHLHSGRISPQAADFDLPRARKTFDALAAARTLARAPDVREALAALEPRPRPYRLLESALPRYRELARDAALTNLPKFGARSLRAGDEYAGAPQLRKLLAALGDLDAATARDRAPEMTLDDALIAALQRFQARHGLEDDEVLGPRTYAALTTPLAHRVRQIELTLERWRWTTALKRPDIVVNIPQFMLFALPPRTAPDAAMLEMPIVVGRDAPQMRTPVFTAPIESVIFQPYWNVPRGILVRELLPLIRNDVRWLARNDMEIVRGPGDDAAVVEPTSDAIEALARGELRLRQRPGPKNALGAVKFLLPNRYSVYLHATPEATLFERSKRAFSHGCIRVSKPAELAAYVLRNEPGEWTPESIEAAMCAPQTRTVKLTRPVRVLIFYGTAAATESAGLLFFDDLYGYDARLERLLLQAF